MDLIFDSDDGMPIDLTTPKLPPKRRSSFFNMVIKEAENKSGNTLRRKKYIKDLYKEKADWAELITKKNARIKE